MSTADTATRNIRLLLRLTDETQTDLAELFGRDPAAITRRMKTGHWSLDELDVIADAHGLPTKALVGPQDDLVRMVLERGSDLDVYYSRCNMTRGQLPLAFAA